MATPTDLLGPPGSVRRLGPDAGWAQAALGNALYLAGRDQEAIAAGQRALARAPRDTVAHINLAMALQRQLRLEEAKVQYLQALELDPNAPQAHGNFANLLADQGHADEALEHYRKAIELAPDYVKAFQNAGATLYDCGRYDEAANYLERAATLAPGDPLVRNMLGLCWARLGQINRAIDCFRGALRIDPQFADASRNLAVTVELARNRSAKAGSATVGKNLPE